MSERRQEKMETASETRRDALKKFGRYAAVATPAMLMLLDSNRQGALATGFNTTSKPVTTPDRRKKRRIIRKIRRILRRRNS